MRLATFIARRPGVVLVVAVLAAFVALLPARNLGLRTDLVGLLPDGTERADDYRIFLERFGGFERVFVMLEPAETVSAAKREAVRGELLAAAAHLAELLASDPEIANVRAGLRDEDETFFYRTVVARAPLLLDGDDWHTRLAERLEPAAIDRRARALRSMLSSPAANVRTDLLRHDPLGFANELEGLLVASAELPVDLVTGGFLAERDDASMVMLTPARSEIDPDGGRALVAALERAFETVRADSSVALEMSALGGPIYAAHDEALLRGDLQWTVGTSLLGCTVILLLAFEGVYLPLALLAPLVLALSWSAGFLGATVGDLTAAGLGFAAILIGLGIDYGIHGGVRYRDRRLRGDDARVALGATLRHAGPGILTSALTTAAAFAALTLAHYRPLRELGWMVATGIVAILVATAFAGSALLTLAPAGRGRPGWLWRQLGKGVEASVTFATRRPRLVLAVTVVLLAGGAVGTAALRIEPDLDALRPEDAPIRRTERVMAERFGLGLDTATVVVPGRDAASALAGAERVSAALAELEPTLAISTPSHWLRGERAIDTRLAALAELPFERAADQLESALRDANLRPSAFAPGIEALRAFGRGEDPAPPVTSSLPDWLGELLRIDADGAWVAVRLRAPEGLWASGPPASVLSAIEMAAPGAAIASVPALGTELRETAVGDLERVGALAFGAVALVVLLAFRGHAGRSLLALAPVTLGVVVTLGLWGGVGRPLDLLGLTVLPILLGIGIDDGLHAVHGARRLAELPGSVRSAGRAMALTTLTTCVGFGSLTLSRVPGLRHGGQIVALGVVLCLLATLFVLPAIGALGRRESES